jgi:fructokinase
MNSSTPPLALGIDLGGTKTEALALAPDGEIHFHKRIPSRPEDYAHTLDNLCHLVREAEAVCGPLERIGMGTPGTLSLATGRMKNSNSTVLNGHTLKEDLEARLGRPVAIANDANCFALSEATDGAAAGAGVVFGVILGTGVGAGLVVNGQILAGANAIAGEWGHNPLPWPTDRERPGRACYCGRRGCIETFLSGPALAADHAKYASIDLSGEAIVTRAEAGDAACLATLARYEERLARALAHVINLLDPHVIVLGGGLSGIARLYENVPKLWDQWVFSDRVDTRLVPPRHGDASGVRGAAWLGQTQPPDSTRRTA